ncbi:MAG: 30S ribosomal protein S9 [Planctomycetales bacterium]|nr:30S ribosomal protein S9 [Planctomycetales bacterium]
MKYGYIWGTGRRKTAVARVRIRPGDGAITVNGRPMDQYFVNIREREIATSALRATEALGRYDVFVNAAGGGPIGQAYATALGTARALKLADTAFEPKLRENGLLTRDSRMKERKKYGRRGARRSFQFSKR